MCKNVQQLLPTEVCQDFTAGQVQIGLFEKRV